MSQRHIRAGDAPLLAWGDALRREKTRRDRFVRRLVLAGAGSAILLLTTAFPPTPRLVWNASASAPTGLYIVTPATWVEPGDMVIAWAPRPFRKLAAERHYVPINVPLVKRVAAYAGDEVCALGHQLFINGSLAAGRRAVDGKGRPMPMWSGCIRLHGRQVFLLMPDPASLDGRYFGATDGTDIVGKARLLWRR